MINGQMVLGVVTARGGSKGVPQKNIRQVEGKPLIGWTIQAAKGANYLDRVILSSDDDGIIEVAKSFGCEVPFKRAPQIAQDDTPSIDVILDALDRCGGFDWVMLLQPTSPLRTSADIDEAIQICVALGAPACVSVCKAEENPFWMFTLRDSRVHPVINMSLFKRRQELPIVYVLNGAIYLARTSWLRQKRTFISEETVAFVMPAERSLDIDDESDLDIFVSMLQKQRNK